MKNLLFIFGLNLICGLNCSPKEKEVVKPKEVTKQISKSALNKPNALNNFKYWEIIPGRSIGPIQIGMTEEKVNKVITLKTHPLYPERKTPLSLNYLGGHKKGKIGSIEISLKLTEKDIKIGDLIIPKATSTIEELRTLIGDCKEVEIRTGGNISVCKKGALSITVGSGDAGSRDQEIWLRVDPI